MGAINILIPVIEGILSLYLENAKEVNLNNSRFDKIKKAVFHLKEDIIAQYKKGLNLYHTENGEKIHFSPQQIKYLVSQERKYLDNWYSIIENFFKSSLFKSTGPTTIEDSLNRHSILHLLERKQYYNLENYIRLFNTLKFLGWIFLRYEKKSIFNQIKTEVFIRKHLQYEAIIEKSNYLITHKQVILKDYQMHNPEEYQYKVYPKTITKDMSFKHKLILKIWKMIDEMLIKNSSTNKRFKALNRF